MAPRPVVRALLLTLAWLLHTATAQTPPTFTTLIVGTRIYISDLLSGSNRYFMLAWPSAAAGRSIQLSLIHTRGDADVVVYQDQSLIYQGYRASAYGDDFVTLPGASPRGTGAWFIVVNGYSSGGSDLYVVAEYVGSSSGGGSGGGLPSPTPTPTPSRTPSATPYAWLDSSPSPSPAYQYQTMYAGNSYDISYTMRVRASWRWTPASNGYYVVTLSSFSGSQMLMVMGRAGDSTTNAVYNYNWDASTFIAIRSNTTHYPVGTPVDIFVFEMNSDPGSFRISVDYGGTPLYAPGARMPGSNTGSTATPWPTVAPTAGSTAGVYTGTPTPGAMGTRTPAPTVMAPSRAPGSADQADVVAVMAIQGVSASSLFNAWTACAPAIRAAVAELLPLSVAGGEITVSNVRTSRYNSRVLALAGSSGNTGKVSSEEEGQGSRAVDSAIPSEVLRIRESVMGAIQAREAAGMAGSSSDGDSSGHSRGLQGPTTAYVDVTVRTSRADSYSTSAALYSAFDGSADSLNRHWSTFDLLSVRIAAATGADPTGVRMTAESVEVKYVAAPPPTTTGGNSTKEPVPDFVVAIIVCSVLAVSGLCYVGYAKRKAQEQAEAAAAQGRAGAGAAGSSGGFSGVVPPLGPGSPGARPAPAATGGYPYPMSPAGPGYYPQPPSGGGWAQWQARPAGPLSSIPGPGQVGYPVSYPPYGSAVGDMGQGTFMYTYPQPQPQPTRTPGSPPGPPPAGTSGATATATTANGASVPVTVTVGYGPAPGAAVYSAGYGGYNPAAAYGAAQPPPPPGMARPAGAGAASYPPTAVGGPAVAGEGKPKKVEEEEEEDNGDCVVCLEKRAHSAALIPCGHVLCATPCADTVLRTSGKCPVCRAAITRVQKLYL